MSTLSPNTLLANLREAIAEWHQAINGDSFDAEHDAARAVVECAEAIDEFMATNRGRRLPSAWNL